MNVYSICYFAFRFTQASLFCTMLIFFGGYQLTAEFLLF
jgi:hypothetical protein